MEIIRAIFGSRLFNFQEEFRCNLMTPECITMRLNTMMARPHIFSENLLTKTIKLAVRWLLGGTEQAEQLRLQYCRALCFTVSRSMTSRKIAQLLSSTLAHDTLFPGTLIKVFDPVKDRLAAAAAVGDISSVRSLLVRGASPDIKSDYFGYALRNAARIGREDMVSLLLAHTKKVENVEYPIDIVQLSLYAACERGQNTVVECLLLTQHEEWLSPTILKSALTAAACNGHIDMVRTLSRRIAQYDKQDMMNAALGTASYRGYPDMVRFLLDSGANLYSYDYAGQNPLHKAAERGHARVVRLLLDRGASYYRGIWGDPLYLAAKNGHEEAVQTLLEFGYDMHAAGPDYCVLERAAKNGESSMVRLCVEKGFDLQESHRGDTALELAAEYGHEDIVALLVGLGVNVNGREDRDGPMLRALMYGQDRVVRVLLDSGAKEADVSKSEYAADFEDGEYPKRRVI